MHVESLCLRELELIQSTGGKYGLSCLYTIKKALKKGKCSLYVLDFILVSNIQP